MSPADTTLARLVEPVEGGLERMREVIVRQVAERSPFVSEMTAHLSRFRGKQLRGALVLLAGEATGRTSAEHPVIAAIVELIHLATLVHDDVLDGASTRRRVPCVHRRWDNQTAVLLGDFLYARAFALSTTLSTRLASRVLADATGRICVGEIDQSRRRYDFELSRKEYEEIASAKTAVLYAAACELGARYPDGAEESGAALRAFGHEIGLAFQIVDDCLDLMGDPEVVGKGVGTDVADGKVTLPVLHAYRCADERGRAAIRRVYTEPGIVDRLAALRAACDLEAGVELAYERARELVDSALLRLEALPAGPARAALGELGGYVLRRRW